MNSKKVLLAIVFIISIVKITAQSQNETLQELILKAIKVSPKIELLKSKLNIAGSKIEQSTNLPDPMLTLGLVNMPTNSFSFTQEPMSGKIIGLTQVFPFPGGLTAKADEIAMDTLIVSKEIEDLKNEIRKNISILYYDLQSVRKEIELTKENKALLTQISDVVKTKYEVAEASLQNIIQVEVQITKEDDKIEVLRGKENSILSELNALLLRDEITPIITEEIKPVGNHQFSSTSLIKVANEYRPFLLGIKDWEQKSKLMEHSASYLFSPNFQIGLQYTQRDYSQITGQNWNDFFSVVVGISLPLNYGGKYSAKINEAKYLQSFYREQYNTSVQSLNQSFGKISAKLNELQVRNKLISETLLPQAEQELKASLADYQVGRIDFVNVINAEKSILKIKIDLLKIKTDYAKNISQLEFLTGKEIVKSSEQESGELK